MRIFDSHVHVSFDFTKKPDNEKLLDTLVYEMKLAGVEKCALMCFYRQLFSKEHMENLCEFLNNAAIKRPDTFYPLLTIDPYQDFEFIEGIIKKYIVNGNISGIKLSLHMDAEHHRFFKVAEVLQKFDIPLLVHVIDREQEKYMREHYESTPASLAILAEKFPRLSIIMAHVSLSGYRGIQKIKDYPNIYADTSGCYYENSIIEYAIEQLGPQRILFASDSAVRDFAVQIKRIEALNVSDEVKRMIFFENSMKLFKRPL